MTASRSERIGCVLIGLSGEHGGGLNIETVPVGNPGNPGELSGMPVSHVCGGVPYVYRIGKFEITAGQYCEVPQRRGRTDTYALYNTSMGSSGGCMIQRKRLGRQLHVQCGLRLGNRPVTYVSWRDALRFANWLTNGQPAGAQAATTTEDGSYDLNVPDSMIERRPTALRHPREHEWYKAAYHKNDGVTGITGPSHSLRQQASTCALVDGDQHANYSNNGYTSAPRTTGPMSAIR